MMLLDPTGAPVPPRGSADGAAQVQIARGVTPIDRSGSIITGGVAQQVAPANPLRGGLMIQNLSASDLWISTVGQASDAPGSIRISANALYELPAHMIGTGVVSIYGLSTGQQFTVWEC